MDDSIASKLLGPQLAHAKTLLDSIYFNGFAADLSETGCGKTYSACAIAKELNVPIVVICPKVVIPTWKKVLTSFGIVPTLVINYEKICRGNTQWMTYDKNKYADKKNWESSGIDLHFPKNCLVIVDEVHKCKGHSSLNGDFLIACKNHGYKSLVMSATAATNPIEMKAFGFLTNLHTGYNFTKFCQMSGVEFNKFGGMVIDLASDRAQQGMLAIHGHLFKLQSSASRMTTKMFDGIFPENRIISELFDMGANTPKIQKIYEQMEVELARLDERASNYSAHIFAVLMEARRKTELLKAPAMVEWVEDLFDEGISPVLFINFTDTLEYVKAKLESDKKFKEKIAVIRGGQGDKVREQDIDDFQSDKKRVMLASISAGSTGVSLHDLNGNHPRHTLVNPSWSAINTLQAFGRCPRQGGKTTVIQKFMFAANTVEERISEKVNARLQNLSALNNGDLNFGFSLTDIEVDTE